MHATGTSSGFPLKWVYFFPLQILSFHKNELSETMEFDLDKDDRLERILFIKLKGDRLDLFSLTLFDFVNWLALPTNSFRGTKYLLRIESILLELFRLFMLLYWNGFRPLQSRKFGSAPGEMLKNYNVCSWRSAVFSWI